MMSAKDSLFEMLVETVPFSFVKNLVQKTPLIYNEAFVSSYEDPRWDESEAFTLLGHLRRALFEKMFRQEAINAGLIVGVENNRIGSCPFTIIKAGNFLLTASYSHSESQMLQSAIFRKQYARVNEMVENPFLPFAEIDAVRLRDADGIYANLLHGSASKKDFRSVGFMRIAIPSSDGTTYVENIDLFEILRVMQQRASTNQEVVLVDIAKPKLKKKIN